MDPTPPVSAMKERPRGRWGARPYLLRGIGCLAVLLASAAPLRPGDPRPELVSVPRFSHPGAGQIFYFVMTDRFANGETANDTGGIPGGPSQSGFDPTKISHYHGGDFVGLTSKLDYIKQIGATAIWITPPFVNKPMQDGTAGYHGYWILDFTRIDPHLGTDSEFRDFLAQAHARGLRVYLDIVVNHTADVIQYKDGSKAYIAMDRAPYRDERGNPFDPHRVAYNGVGTGDNFPRLSAERSFPHVPVVPPAEAQAKAPPWLNDVTLYHNRGDSTFKGESSLFGDFGGLDDVFTENPAVVRGFIDVYSQWMEGYGIDGFRIDTVKHVNLEFWEAFGTAIRAKARALGRPDFLEFGEVSEEGGDAALLSEFSTTGTLDGTIDFVFSDGARDFVSRQGDAEQLADLFRKDAWYTSRDGSAQEETTFVSNHDAGRFAYFLTQDNPGADARKLSRLFLLAQELLLTVRGQPALYYGDEQGMVGIGNDMGAREDMFASKAPKFSGLSLLGTDRKGADDKFDPNHPFYRTIRTLSLLRSASPALSRGAMIIRDSGQRHVFAFSRIERDERVEFLVAMNNSRTESARATLATCQPPGSELTAVFESAGARAPHAGTLLAGKDGTVTVALDPLECIVWRARNALPVPGSAPAVRFDVPEPGATMVFTARSIFGHVIPVRHELRAVVEGGDGFAEVTFCMKRASRPGQYEWLGTADSPPYSVYWRPPADLSPGEELEFVATVDDLRGHRDSARIGRMRVAPTALSFGIGGATVPVFTREPDAVVTVAAGQRLTLATSASGTSPVDFSWFHDGRQIAGATDPVLTLDPLSPPAAGRYLALAHNREGTAVTHEIVVHVGTPPPSP